MPMCPYCHTIVSEDTRFCPECGHPLALGEIVVGEAAEGKSKKKLAGIIVGCIIAIIVAIVIPKLIEPTPTQFKTYSKYDFSFEYPKTFSVSEMGMLENEANDTSGMVQVGVENEEVELFKVIWIKMMPNMIEIGPSGLEGNLKYMLEDTFVALESTVVVASVETGELVEATKAGHLMFYQYYTATSTEGGEVYGIAGCFYCYKNQELFLLMTANNTISAKKDVLGDFQNYLGSFVCH